MNEDKRDVITTKIFEAIKTANISEQTREILLIKASLNDAINSLINWANKYDLISEDATDKVACDRALIERTIDECIIRSINDNMSNLKFKGI